LEKVIRWMENLCIVVVIGWGALVLATSFRVI
jgi:hypothetical protein